MRFGERGRGIWTAAIAEADKQTTQRCEAIFPHGHPFRRAFRRGVCPGSGTVTWRALRQKLPLLHGHHTRERTASSLQFKPRTCCSAEGFSSRIGERGTPLGEGAAARICGTGPRLFSLFTAACPDGGTAFSSAPLSTAPPAQSAHNTPLSDATGGGQQEPLPRPPKRTVDRVPLLAPLRPGLLRADNHKVLRAFFPFNNSRGAGPGKIRQEYRPWAPCTNSCPKVVT